MPSGPTFLKQLGVASFKGGLEALSKHPIPTLECKCKQSTLPDSLVGPVLQTVRVGFLFNLSVNAPRYNKNKHQT